MNNKKKQTQNFVVMNTFKTSSGFLDFPLFDSWKSTVNEKKFQLQPSKLLKSKTGFFYPKIHISFLYYNPKTGIIDPNG